MNVVDASGWLEYFAGGGNAGFFSAAIEDVDQLLVPTITIYEVFRRVAEQRGEDDALKAVAAMQQGRVVDLSIKLALAAARLAVAQRLGHSESQVLATAQAFGATLWTQDPTFEGMREVRYKTRGR